jgi:predicted nuclease of predicted toxin-antitoxin system
MKLLFDHNLSPKLVTRLSDLYPDSNHVYPLELYEVEDPEIRNFAAANGFIVVTKDADYSEMHSLFGAPPKIVWIRRGNCSTTAIETILRNHVEDILKLTQDDSSGILTLF